MHELIHWKTKNFTIPCKQFFFDYPYFTMIRPDIVTCPKCLDFLKLQDKEVYRVCRHHTIAR
jgi:hypothetical protein